MIQYREYNRNPRIYLFTKMFRHEKMYVNDVIIKFPGQINNHIFM